MSASVLITDDYRRLQQELHRDPNYGVASIEYAPIVAKLMAATGVREILDYGAGKGRLGLGLDAACDDEPVTIHYYEPAIPEWSKPPEPCPLVACIDVLEHIEPELLDNVLDDLKRVTAGFGLFSVHTGPAAKVLQDGRNAHLIQAPASWWLPKLLARFELVKFERLANGFYVIVERKRD